MSHNILRPIVKWSSNRANISNMVVSCLPNNCKSYWEPFLGNAALALRIYKYDAFVEKLNISDPSVELVSFYQHLRDDGPKVVDEVQRLAAEFNAAPDREVAYRNLRDLYNNSEAGCDKSILFYILNQTCYNGMMRFNKKGSLNSSYSGRPCEIYPETMKAFSNFLNDERVNLFHSEFEAIDPDPLDVVFLGPPDNRRWYNDHRAKLQGLWEAWSSKNVFLMLTGKDEELLQELFSGWYFMAIGKRLMVLNY